MDKYIMHIATAAFLSFFVLIALHALVPDGRTARADVPALAEMVRK